MFFSFFIINIKLYQISIFILFMEFMMRGNTRCMCVENILLNKKNVYIIITQYHLSTSTIISKSLIWFHVILVYLHWRTSGLNPIFFVSIYNIFITQYKYFLFLIMLSMCEITWKILKLIQLYQYFHYNIFHMTFVIIQTKVEVRNKS